MDPHTIIDHTFESLTRVTAQGSVLILCLIGIRFALKERISPSWGYALWLLVLIRLTVWDLPDTSWSLFNFASNNSVTTSTIEIVRHEALAPNATTTSDQSQTPEPSFARESADVEPALPLETTDPVTSGELPLIAPSNGIEKPDTDSMGEPFVWYHLFVVIWGVVTSLLAAKFLFLNIRFALQLNQSQEIQSSQLQALFEECKHTIGVKRHVQLVESAEVDTPAVFGLFRIRLLIPSGQINHYTMTEWRNLLLHELAHVKRHDITTNLWLIIVEILHWYNPLVHWMASKMRIERELACDAHALSASQDTDPKQYGETILKVVTQLPASLTVRGQVAVLENKKHIKERIHMIAKFTHRPKIQMIAACLWVAIAAVLLTEGQAPEPPERLKPISLNAHYDHPNAVFDNQNFLATSDQAWTWSHAPKGRQEFFGIPFEVEGVIRLSSTEADRDGRHHRSSVTGIPVGAAYAKIYLLHATYYSSPEEETTARIRINYTDTSHSMVDLKYGVHARDWWRHKYEFPVNLSHSASRVVWTGNDQRLATYGKSLRLCLTVLDVPKAGKEIATLDFISAHAHAAHVIFAVTGGVAELPEAWQSTPKRLEPEMAHTQSIAFNATDKDSGEPITNLHLRVEGADANAHFFVGRFFTDATGKATIRFPGGPLTYLTIWANADGYPPMIVQWDTRHHGDFPSQYDYSIHKGVEIGGRIENASGEPVEGAEIHISKSGQIDFSSGNKEVLAMTKEMVTSDENGHWSYGGIPANLEQYTLSFHHPDYQPSYMPILTRTLSDSSPHPAKARGRLDVTHTSLTSQQAVVRLAVGSWLHGTIRDSSGEPVENARINLAPFGNMRTTLSDSLGVFHFENVPSYSRALTVEHPDFHFQNFSLDTDNNAPLDIRLESSLPFRAQVLGNGDEPIGNAYVRFASNDRVWQTFTDEEGIVSIPDAPADSFSLVISHEDYIGQQVTVQRDGDGIHKFQLEPALILKGNVINQITKAPIAHARITTGTRMPGTSDIHWKGAPQAVVINGQYRIKFEGGTRFEQFLLIEAEGFQSSTSRAYQKTGTFSEHFELKTANLP